MKPNLLWIAAAGLALAGCGSSSSDNKAPTAAEVKDFKGNPNSPDLQRALRAHMGGGPPPGPPPGATPAAGSSPAGN